MLSNLHELLLEQDEQNSDILFSFYFKIVPLILKLRIVIKYGIEKVYH